MNELEQRKQSLERDLSRSGRLNELQSYDSWSIVDEILADLSTFYANRILKGDEAVGSHDSFLRDRGALDGLEAVRTQFSLIKRKGVEAANALDQIAKDESGR